jgi:hypothetical protein
MSSNDKARVRVRDDFMVPVSKLKKNGQWKEKKKEYFAGEWLRGRFVTVRDRRMFRTGEFLLSPSHFDQVKFPEGAGMSFEELNELLNSPAVIDLHDRHDLLS